MATALANPTIITMGMGQESITEPTLALLGFGEYFSEVIVVVKEALRITGKSKPLVFDDDINVYTITAMLSEINQSPLDNPLFNKMTKLILEKQIRIDTLLKQVASHRSEPYRIVSDIKKVKRGIDE